jgi:peroxiredoxin
MEAVTVAPGEGALLSLFALPDDSGRIVDIGNFRQRRNMVLCFCRTLSPETLGILKEMAAAASGIAAEEGVAIAVVSGGPGEARKLRKELGLPFPVLADEKGKIQERFCPREVALYVTDRFGEIFLVRHGRDALVTGQFIVDRLNFIERQCPE